MHFPEQQTAKTPGLKEVDRLINIKTFIKLRLLQRCLFLNYILRLHFHFISDCCELVHTLIRPMRFLNQIMSLCSNTEKLKLKEIALFYCPFTKATNAVCLCSN